MQISSQHLENFLSKIEAGYGRYGNPYHNATHAADVAITTHYFIHSLGLKVSIGNRRVYSGKISWVSFKIQNMVSSCGSEALKFLLYLPEWLRILSAWLLYIILMLYDMYINY